MNGKEQEESAGGRYFDRSSDRCAALVRLRAEAGDDQGIRQAGTVPDRQYPVHASGIQCVPFKSPETLRAERTNIRHVTIEDTKEFADFASIDVSFISLKLVLPKAKELLNRDGEVVALIKPQFEAGKGKVGKKGVVRDKNVHIEVIEAVSNFAVENGFAILNLDYSPIKGPEGNIEYLIHLKNNNDNFIFDKESFDKKIVEVVEESHNLNK